MKTVRLVILALAALVFCALPLFAADVPYRADLAAARAEAAKSGRTMLVVVGTASCPACVRQERTAMRDPAVCRLCARVVPVKVDAQADPGAAKQLGVRAYPTTLLVDADGTVLARREGCQTPGQMAALIRTAPAK